MLLTEPRPQGSGFKIACFLAVAAAVASADTPARRVVNGWEVYNEAHVKPGSESAVKDHFPSFLEYQDLIMFHPRFGYYGSGRVSFISDYQTFPNTLAPFFGHMVAEQVFRMWRGMRQAGTIGPTETFTIAEFGAGNGSLAESILDYLQQKAREDGDKGWRDFNAQVKYACYDRSPALSKKQRERNARFGARFEAREGDATDPLATIPAGSLKGVVLSNELPDAFSVQKVVLNADGSAEVAFVAPSLPRAHWEELKKQVPPAVVDTVEKGDATIRARFFDDKQPRLSLTRDAFSALLDALITSKEYESAVQSLQFQEVYIPASLVPEVADHLKRYARLYALELARNERGVVTYINPGVEKFIQGCGRILKAGYVITLDYGSNWEGIISQDLHPHLRTYGPAHQEENRTAGDTDGNNIVAGDRDTSDPYRGPTLNDMTTDVNFSMMEAEGRLAGLTAVYYGPQAGLQAGTDVSLLAAPAERADTANAEEFFSWADKFHNDVNYKLMVQKKDGTDPKYVYPEPNSEPLNTDPKHLDDRQRARAAELEKKLGR